MLIREYRALLRRQGKKKAAGGKKPSVMKSRTASRSRTHRAGRSVNAR
jgi:hypothetical protein